MPYQFSQQLVLKYQTYIKNRLGIVLPEDIAQKDLENLADLFCAAANLTRDAERSREAISHRGREGCTLIKSGLDK